MRRHQGSWGVAVPAVVLAVAVAADRTTIIVHAPAGALRGAVENNVASFRGVPYAAPPVGSLRWRDPAPAAAWNGTRDALADGAACPQECALPVITCPTIISENCLFVNVFAPANASMATAAAATAAAATAAPGAPLLPIMFWIHGGNFYQGYGGGILYDGSHLAREHGVVVVALNYRLGALGFLRTGGNAATGDWTGNFGLKDQQAALRWVRANGAAFGGDAARLTIFGQSAGAASVGAHLQMPGSRGLFAAAILQSNPLGLPFRAASKYRKFARVVARKAKCAGLLGLAPRRRWQRCLEALPWQQLVAAQKAAQADLLADVGQVLSLFQPFSPAVGTPELPRQTLAAMLAGGVADVPLVLGSVRQEGVIFLYEAFTKPEPVLEEALLVDLVYSHRREIMRRYPLPAAARAANDARNHTAVLATDSLFHCAIRHAARALARNDSGSGRRGARSSPTFVYHFDHIISFGAKFWLPTSPICVDTVCHAEELPFVFAPDLTVINASFTPAEAALAHSMGRYWTNVAKAGAPGSDGAISWPTMDGAERALRFTTDPANSIDTARYADKCAFWDSLGYKWIL
eukprot:g965.t1